ncbi:MAG: hypothetical protein IT212_05825 [Bacteroidia bacterium]|nr:hypothetical protein [Bacteroidia bacterium]
MKQLRFYYTIILLTTLSFFFACNNGNRQVKFDKNKWNDQADPLFPSVYRSKMLTDLTTNYKLKGLKYSELIELLGIPDSKDSSSLSYKIVVDYKHDIDPVYTKDLDFTFSKDSIITSFQINEWKK